MKLEQLLLLHLMAGAGVAVCVYLSVPSDRVAQRLFQTVAAVVFWPLFLPLLLSQRREVEGDPPSQPDPDAPDELSRAIAQVEGELEAALQSLDTWTEDLRERAQDRFRQLRTVWSTQAERIREMDQILVRSRDVPAEAALLAASDRVRESQEVIRQNVEQLGQVRQRTLDNLLGMLARVRELVSAIHLARFTAAPAAQAEELLAQMDGVVEGVGFVIRNGREEICRLNRD